jgi:hypothetical protein
LAWACQDVELRQHIDRGFHECGHEIHRQCAQDYLANDDDNAPGLWQYIHDAIIANCRRAADGQDHPDARQADR